MKKFYVIIRIDSNGFDAEIFEQLKKWHRRRWYRKMLAFLQNWDYGDENVGAAIVNGDVWDTPTDPVENDEILLDADGQHLCHAYSEDGLYEAFYLVGETELETY